jgi:hypothetical protein
LQDLHFEEGPGLGNLDGGYAKVSQLNYGGGISPNDFDMGNVSLDAQPD